MNPVTLNLWGKGSVTLPKAWRDKYQTKIFLAKENSNGSLVITPVLDEVFEYEEDGYVGLHFPYGIAPEVLLKDIHAVQKEQSQKRKKASRSKRRNG